MKKIFTCVIAAMTAMSVMAQDDAETIGFAYEAGFEGVSSYIWRGQYNGGLSFQPEALVGFNALDEAIQFRGGLWANVGSSDNAWKFTKDGTGYTKFMPEVDFMATFTAYGATVGFTEYYYCDDFSSATSEISIGYNFDHFFEQDAYINWYTTVAGADMIEDEDGNEKRAWSTYIELGYSYTWDNIGLTLGGEIGLSPWASDLYGNESFACTNISLKLNKEFEFEYLTLDIFAQGSLNPDHVNTQNAYINKAGDDKLYNQKLNATLGIGLWF